MTDPGNGRDSHRGGADPGIVRSAELLTTGGLDSSLVDWGYYRHGYRQEHISYADAVDLARRGDGLVWIGLLEPTENQVALLGEEFGLHPLAVEDAVKAHQRPKLERYAAASDGTGVGDSGDTLFAVFK